MSPGAITPITPSLLCSSLSITSSLLLNTSQFLSHIAPSSEPVWIGLSDGASEGNYYWVKDLPATDTFITSASNLWNDGEPNQTGGNEDCVGYYDGKLQDRNCDNQLSFICEKGNFMWVLLIVKVEFNSRRE